MKSTQKNLFFTTIVCFVVVSAYLLNRFFNKNPESKLDKKSYPSDHFYMQRSFPDAAFDHKAYFSALQQAKAMAGIADNDTIPGTGDAWQLEGPLNINGRVNTIAVHPDDPNIIYFGTSSGGIFKSTDGGTSWNSIFDDFAYMAIGTIVLDPLNPDVVYAGTGDPNIGGYPFIGNGIYKSTNAGNTWTHLGLSEQRIISRIAIDSSNTNIIYAATMGLPFERNNQRGLYKSTNGGTSWNQILFITDDAGIIDLVMHPANPQILYAAGWNRIRNHNESIISGPAAKIYKTTDGGANWDILTNGLPSTDQSRIGLCISPSNPEMLYASYIGTDLELQGIYQTTNGGNNWAAVSTSGLDGMMGGFGWYFGQIRVHPANPNDISILGVYSYRTTDGGSNWEALYGIGHVDHHDLVLYNTNQMLIGTDGGLYKSTNNGTSWDDPDNTPSTQYYRLTMNMHNNTYVGGAQDNGTIGGNSSNLNNWYEYYGADGFQAIFDPNNINLEYYEWQNGGLVYNDNGYVNDFTNGIDGNDRRSWDMPFIMSSHVSTTLYTGTYRVYKHTNAPNGTWTAISNDLTDGTNNRYHIISTVAESYKNANILYAGTSDAKAWRTTNGGTQWTEISAGLPTRYISHIETSPDFENTVYIAHSGYKSNDFIPHIHKSTNNGSTWTDISGDLPQLAVNNIAIPKGHNDNFIFVATDGGVYVTHNGGQHWERLGLDLPYVIVYDILFDSTNTKLVAATHGKAILSYDCTELLTAGINKNKTNNIAFTAYPNPVTDKLTITCKALNNEKVRVRLCDVKGKLADSYSAVFAAAAMDIDMRSYKPGVYVLTITDATGQRSVSTKVVKR